MSKYIEVYTACNKLRRRLDELKTIVPPMHYDEVVHSANLIIRFLQEQPQEDVVKLKRGKWVQTGDVDKDGNAWYECSFCHKGDCHAASQIVSYCWNCGAEMRKDK